jgi:serine/threonine-protein kinase HipA
MKQCAGCYRMVSEDFCPTCRKTLFDGANMTATLEFTAPNEENLMQYQEKTKRLSISGVQLKYSVRLEGKKLVLAETNGQYILKPIPPSLQIQHADQAPENEHLTMQIARQVFQIRTAANALVYFNDGIPAYLTRRFDVKKDGTKNLQEDMAQISGRSSASHGENFKYNGTYEEIGRLIKKYVLSYPQLEEFYKVVLFNYLLSNGDAHLKNFSIIQSIPDSYTLAPAYDLMSTMLHVPGETDTALDLYDGDTDGEYYGANGYYGIPEFKEFATRIGIVTEVRLKILLDTLLSNSEKVYAMVDASKLSAGMKEEYKNNYKDKLQRFR